MAAAAARADLIYITNDNPRREDPTAIAHELVEGLSEHDAVIVELDRAKAILMAIENASPDDVILICGKGHETEQIVAGTRRHFSDREIARHIVAQRSS